MKLDQRPPVQDDGLIDTKELGFALGVHGQRIRHWREKALIPFEETPDGFRYDLDAVRAAVANMPELSLGDGELPEMWTTSKPAEPLIEVAGPARIGEDIRSRALAAAKEAFREVVLEAADQAKKRGDFQTQAGLLEEFIFFEDGVQLVYDGRAK